MSLFRANPVLGREVGVRLRLSRYSKVNKIAIFGTLFGVLPIIYMLTLRLLFNRTSINAGRDFYSAWMMLIEMTAALLLPAALTASTITSEREKQTWNALLLSRLSDGQIVLGKLVGALTPAFLLFALFFPINLVAASVAEIPASTFIAGHAVLLVSALLSACIGLFCSWAFRRTQIALVLTVLSLLVVMLGAPLLYVLATMTTPSTVHTEDFFPYWFNPHYVIYRLAENPDNLAQKENIPATTIAYLVSATIASLMMLFTVTKRLKLGPEELNH
ncbi:MAG: ABC transporter permease [Armatimonas sp.]